jgi:thymidylate synthase (FAD)
MYMNGTVRSWIHYIQIRTGPETQKEHREVAEQIKLQFVKHYPGVSKALGWT